MSKQKQQENEVNENELVTYFEEKLGHVKPYWSQIALGACIVIMAMIGGAYLLKQAQAMEAIKWQDLNVAVLNYKNNQDNTSLELIADQYPDDTPGMWALLYAADADVRSGLSDFLTDRTAGKDKIEKAQGYYQKILDSSVNKSTMLIQRTTFGLAYANESLGQFNEAQELYDQLAKIDDCPFAADAKRGSARCQNPELVKLYNKFVEYVPPTEEEAPGVDLPERPDISFPELDNMQPESGGEFSPGQEPEGESDSSSDGAAATESEMSDGDSDANAETDAPADTESDSEPAGTVEPDDSDK